MWRAANDNSYVQLRGQGERPFDAASNHGYVMAALLVGMSVMAVLLGAALPVWNKQAQREREEEYLFRAHEYARGVMKFQRRAGPGTLPPTLDVLVQQRFVRRKYKDPLSGEDFQPVFQTVNRPGQPGSGAFGAATPGAATPGAASPGSGSSNGTRTGSSPSSGPATPPSGGSPLGATPTSGFGGTATSNQGAPGPGAGVIGVVSKSKKTSIKVWNGRTRYDQWAVTYQDVKAGKGLPPDLIQALNAGGAGGAGAPGQATPGANPFGNLQPGAAPGQGGANPFGTPGANPFGAPGTNPFNGRPGQGGPAAPGANPFGSGGAAPGASPFSPAYPPPAGGGAIFGGTTPPRK